MQASEMAACNSFAEDFFDALRDLFGFLPGLARMSYLAKECKLGGFAVLKVFKKV